MLILLLMSGRDWRNIWIEVLVRFTLVMSLPCIELFMVALVSLGWYLIKLRQAFHTASSVSHTLHSASSLDTRAYSWRDGYLFFNCVLGLTLTNMQVTLVIDNSHRYSLCRSRLHRWLRLVRMVDGFSFRTCNQLFRFIHSILRIIWVRLVAQIYFIKGLLGTLLRVHLPLLWFGRSLGRTEEVLLPLDPFSHECVRKL